MTRNQQLLRCVPDALRHKTLLYVGASRRRQQMLSLFVDRNYRITVLEAWLPNAMYVGGTGRNTWPSTTWRRHWRTWKR